MQSYILKAGVGFFLIICLIIISVMLYGVYTLDINPESQNTNKEGQNAKYSQTNTGSGELGSLSPIINENGSVSEAYGAVGGISGGGGGSGGSSASTISEPEEIKLPEDLYTAPCGIYFRGYGVCNGSCSEGVCTQEGRSCYCKLA